MAGKDKAIISIRGSIALAVIGGCLSAVQIRINGELGQVAGSAIVAALISFVVGMCCAWLVVVLFFSQSARAFKRLRVRRQQWWLFTGGLYGSFYVTMLVIAGPIIGVAATTVAIVAGKITGGLLLDRLHIFSATPITLRRFAGAGLAIAAIAISQMGAQAGSWQPVLALLLCVGGVALSTQAAVQGAFQRQTGSLALVTALNFTLGTVVLLAVLLSTKILGDARALVLPTDWWLYLGGALGAICVSIIATVAPIIGVLRLMMAVAIGQLFGAIALDYALPIGPGFRIQLLIAALLTIAALWVASKKGKKTAPRLSAAAQSTE